MRQKYIIEDPYKDNCELHEFMEYLPENFKSGGSVIFMGKRNVIKNFCLKRGDSLLGNIVVKRYSPRNIFQKFAYSFFIKSKAAKAFTNGRKMLEIGCLTPTPLAYSEEYKGGFLTYCYYVTTFTDAQSVKQALEEDFNKQLALEFTKFIVRLHQNGLVHHDLNFSNVLYQQKDDTYTISAIDINRLTIKKKGKLSIKECKDDYVRWTDRKDLFTFVMQQYATLKELDENTFLKEVTKMKAEHDKAWKRRKNFWKKVKKLWKS